MDRGFNGWTPPGLRGKRMPWRPILFAGEVEQTSRVRQAEFWRVGDFVYATAHLTAQSGAAGDINASLPFARVQPLTSILEGSPGIGMGTWESIRPGSTYKQGIVIPRGNFRGLSRCQFLKANAEWQLFGNGESLSSGWDISFSVAYPVGPAPLSASSPPA